MSLSVSTYRSLVMCLNFISEPTDSSSSKAIHASFSWRFRFTNSTISCCRTVCIAGLVIKSILSIFLNTFPSSFSPYLLNSLKRILIATGSHLHVLLKTIFAFFTSSNILHNALRHSFGNSIFSSSSAAAKKRQVSEDNENAERFEGAPGIPYAKAEYTDQVSGKSNVSFNAADLLLTKEDAKK